MSGLTKMLMGAVGAILAVIGIFFYGKRSGKNESENEQRKQIIDGIEKRHKINDDVSRMPNHELDRQLLDEDTDK